MSDLQPDHPSAAKVLAVFDSVGLKYSGIVMKAVVIEGGVDLLKAGYVPSFAKEITDHNGGISPKTFQAGILAGRRALLAHAVDILVKEHGVQVLEHHLTRDHVMDEAYDLKVDDLTMNLWLCPR